MILAQGDTVILDVKILKSSNIANGFSTTLAEDGTFALLSFDYLNSKDGVVLQVIHTGVSLVSFIITGEIKGVKEIKYKMKT